MLSEESMNLGARSERSQSTFAGHRNGEASMHKDFRVGLLTLNVFLDYFCWDTDCQHAGWKVPCYDRSCTDNSYRTDVQVVDERCSNPNVNPLANPAPSSDVGAGSNVGAVCNLHVVTNKCTAIDHHMRPDLTPSCNHTMSVKCERWDGCGPRHRAWQRVD